MNLKSFKHNDWTKIYDGKWSFLTSTHFIHQYTKELRFGTLPFKSQSIILVSRGFSSGWMRQSDRDKLGKYLSSQIEKSPRFAIALSNKLKNQAKSFLAFIDHNESKKPSLKLYDEFWSRLLAYYHPHINVKYVVDYLKPELLEKYLPYLQSARLAAEPVLNRTEDFLVSFAKNISRKIGYSYKLVLCFTKEEMREYLKTETTPSKNELEVRDKGAALIADKTGYQFFPGRKTKEVERLLVTKSKAVSVSGFKAYHGKVKGRVVIVTNPKNSKGFKVGDILVTGATRPEFLPIMEKASAFVTDAGGILSHAAITAREMKKPCVVGTKDATRVFKDGDKVEVDADKGTVKKIEKDG